MVNLSHKSWGTNLVSPAGDEVDDEVELGSGGVELLGLLRKENRYKTFSQMMNHKVRIAVLEQM